jgi:predicted nucleic-acid-binding protein
MIAVDTNVVVRVITRDDPEQAARAAQQMRAAELWLGKTMLLETEWVLRHAYGYAAAEVGTALRILVGLDNAYVEDAGAVIRALSWHAAGMDFADALHLASSADAATFVTFDERLVTTASRLESTPRVELVASTPPPVV